MVARHGTRLSVLFGSNLGTAEGIATRLAQEGSERGWVSTTADFCGTIGQAPPPSPPADQL